MKVFFRRIHLYLSLLAGIPVLIACFTGAVLVFEKDLQVALNKDRYYVQPSANRLTLDSLKTAAVAAFRGNKVTGIKIYNDPKRSAELALSADKKEDRKERSASAAPAKKGGGKEARGGGGPQAGFTVFMNPYTAQVLEKYSYRETFFFQMMALHRWLLGGNDSAGKWIMGVSTAIFLFIIITGIVLWWPKTRKILAQRLKIKSNSGWKRLNHDLHIVLGFYSAIFLFIFAFTALAWSFEWFNKSIYTLTNSSMKGPEAPKSVTAEASKTITFDDALQAVQPMYVTAQFYNINAPKDAADAFSVSVLPEHPAHESATDLVYVDQYAGTVIGEQTFAQRSQGARVRSFFRPVHTGSLWGMPSKIIAFIVCVLGVSFPVTGVIMWWNRTRKKKSPIRSKERLMA